MTLKKILNCYLGRSALPAFNLDCLLTYQAVEQAVTNTRLPAIVQLSPSEELFIHANRLTALVSLAHRRGLPLFLNLDHGSDPEKIKECLSLGFDMVHFDGSSLPLDENQKITRHLSTLAHRHHALLEAEIDHINPTSQKSAFTDPQIAQKFIKKTKADFLAVAVGNKHGQDPKNPEYLDLPLLKKIHTALPHTLLTMHGGSGIPSSNLRQSFSLGVVKVNINTHLRQILRPSLEKTLSQNPSLKAYEYLTPSLQLLTKEIEKILTDFARSTP